MTYSIRRFSTTESQAPEQQPNTGEANRFKVDVQRLTTMMGHDSSSLLDH